LAGLKPNEIWELELWEFNTYVTAFKEKQKSEISQAILTGYYAAYYTNGGKKVKTPNELISKMYAKKQSYEEGLSDIERLQELEKRGNKNI